MKLNKKKKIIIKLKKEEDAEMEKGEAEEEIGIENRGK
jgi:hypothetical protein